METANSHTNFFGAVNHFISLVNYYVVKIYFFHSNDYSVHCENAAIQSFFENVALTINIE